MIVYENEDTRLVRLDEQYYSGDGQLVQLFARFNEHTVVLSHCFSVSGKPKSFMLNAQEMEALSNAWITYQNDQREKAEAEQKRLADVEAEAYQLAEDCKAIQIDKHDGHYWTVSIPEINWEYFDPAYNVDELLEMVKGAIEYYRPIQEAYKLAATCPAVKIEQRTTKWWWISIPEPDLFGQNADREQLIQIIQLAIENYSQWQAKQDAPSQEWQEAGKAFLAERNQ